jgi:hypothetical protein
MDEVQPGRARQTILLAELLDAARMLDSGLKNDTINKIS